MPVSECLCTHTHTCIHTWHCKQTRSLTLARNDNAHTTHTHTHPYPHTTHTHTPPIHAHHPHNKHIHACMHACHTHTHTYTPTHTHTAVTLRVYTMKPEESVQMTFPSGRFTTVTQIMEQLLSNLRMSPENADTFSIWLSSKHLRKL